MTAEHVADFDPSRPFTRAAGIAAGLAKSLRTTAYRTLFHGIYVSATSEVTPLLRAEAALLPFAPRAWASHATAGRIHRVPVTLDPDEHVTVLDPKERRSRNGVICHLAQKGLIVTIDGVRVSAPAQCFVELATTLPLVELVVVGDDLVRRGKVSLEALRKHCADATGPGAQSARKAVAYVRERVDSARETRLRMLLVLAGLPEPEINVLAGDGVAFRKYDLSYRRSKTIVEYDGGGSTPSASNNGSLTWTDARRSTTTGGASSSSSRRASTSHPAPLWLGSTASC